MAGMMGSLPKAASLLCVEMIGGFGKYDVVVVLPPEVGVIIGVKRGGCELTFDVRLGGPAKEECNTGIAGLPGACIQILRLTNCQVLRKKSLIQAFFWTEKVRSSNFATRMSY